MKSTPGEDAMNIVELTTKNLEYYISLIDIVTVYFERIDFNFKRSSTVGKMLSNSITSYRRIIHKRFNQCGKVLCCLKKLPQPPQYSEPTL